MRRSLLDRLNLESSLQDEVERSHDRLPSRVAEIAVEGHIDEYAARIESRCEAGLTPTAHELVWMPKANLRYRPLSALPLAERAVFRGFAGDLQSSVIELDAYADTRDTFELELLEADSRFSHFALTDISSFYRYVPHELLHRRIAETTGRSDLADAVRAFLRETMQASIGVPQNVGPSDQFADLVVAPVERRLVRRGVPITRYNDDFRIAGRSNRAVRRGIEALQNELYQYGLMLNDSKTTILLRENYEAHVDQIAGEEYEDVQALDDEPTAYELKATKAALRTALSPLKRARTRLQEVKALSDVRRSLRRLARWKEPYAIRRGQAILNRYPSLTQHYARYLAALVDAGSEEDVAEYLESHLGKFILTPWQELWLLEPVIAGAPADGPRIGAWLERNLEPDTAPILRARAALAAAEVEMLDTSTASLIVDTSPESARSDAIAALSRVHSGADAGRMSLAGLPDTLLASWIYGYEDSTAAPPI